MAEYHAIDADGHVEETHVNWKERLPERYRFLAPERRAGGDGQSRLMIEADGRFGLSNAIWHGRSEAVLSFWWLSLKKKFLSFLEPRGKGRC